MHRKLIIDPQHEDVMEIRNRLLAFNLERIEDKDPHDFVSAMKTTLENSQRASVFPFMAGGLR